MPDGPAGPYDRRDCARQMSDGELAARRNRRSRRIHRRGTGALGSRPSAPGAGLDRGERASGAEACRRGADHARYLRARRPGARDVRSRAGRAIAKRIDVAFTALPHGASTRAVSALCERGRARGRPFRRLQAQEPGRLHATVRRARRARAAGQGGVWATGDPPFGALGRALDRRSRLLPDELDPAARAAARAKAWSRSTASSSTRRAA